ncbi:MAG TPA: hypothetical protein VFZ83_13095 [Acidimicrobiia bacterium]|nr:hypothetical protein [Acidimicrobiia bacterium]
MSDGMPYHFEKGPTWQVFDTFFSGADRIKAKLFVLESLWTEPRFTGFVDSFAKLPANLPLPTAPYGSGIITLADLIEHANAHWFGLPTKIGGNPASSDGYDEYDPTSSTATGFWKNWRGDAERVVRMAFIRAIEVSLGLRHPAGAYDPLTPPAQPPIPPPTSGDAITHLYADHEDPSGSPYAPTLDDAASQTSAQLATRFARNWPIEFWWLCGPRYFQASVTWRRKRLPGDPTAQNPEPPSGQPRSASDDSGRVNVVFITPGATSHVIFHDLEHPPENPPVGPRHPGGAEHAIDPARSEDRFGSWIVGHRFTESDHGGSHEPSHAGECPCPIQQWKGTGRVVTVQPRYEDGGVLLHTPY